MITIDHLPYLGFLLSEIVVALVFGVYLFARARTRLPAERLCLLICPVAILVTLTMVTKKILETPEHDWNGARLIPLIGLFYGADMYVGPDGPDAILNTIYPPLSYLAYFPTALFSNPTYAIIAGSFLSVVMYFTPAILLAFSRRRNETGSRFSLLGIATMIGFVQFTFLSQATLWAALQIHADAPMLGFLGVACVVLYRNRGETTLRSSTCLVSAILAAMALWSKQTAAPMIAALPFWILLNHGMRSASRFLVALVAALAGFTLLFWTMLDFDSLMFNILRIPKNHPWIYQGKELSRGILILSADYFFAIAALLASILLTLFARSQLTPDPEPGSEARGLRGWVRENSWLLFVLMALAAVPTSLLSRIKVGGFWANFSPTPYFLGISLIALLMDWAAKNRRLGLTSFNAMLTFTVMILVLSPLTRSEESFAVINTVQSPLAYAHELAYRYSLRHPGTAYFPWQPLSTLLGEGKVCHFDYGIFDRELAKYHVSQEHFRRNIPANLRYVCYPPYYKGMPFYQQSMKYLPEYNRRVEIPELPGWECYER